MGLMPLQLVIGISDCKASDNPKASFVTYALGSCVGVAIYDPTMHVGGLAHIMLPQSRGISALDQNPFIYADTGVIGLAREVIRLGGHKDRIVAKIAGGANMLSTSSILDIGARNSKAVISTLNMLNIRIMASDVGGNAGRTMHLFLATGAVVIRTIGGGEETL